MSLELLNTSAPRGVRPDTSGFCTVAMTVGMTPGQEERLALLSNYTWLAAPGEMGAANNPVAFAHWRLMEGARTLSVLSRVCDAGIDYLQRPNRLAHHVALEPAEQVDAGPAWVMIKPGVMRTSWDGEPMEYVSGPEIPTGGNPPRLCQAWEKAAGDAGWAGMLAGTFAADPSQICWLIYPPGLEILPLIDEAIALLPVALRWQVTFSTNFTELPEGMSCAWRCCAAGSQAAADAARLGNGAALIDLTQRLPPAPENPYVTLARRHAEPQAQRTNPHPLSSLLSRLTVFELTTAGAGSLVVEKENIPAETDSLPRSVATAEAGAEVSSVEKRDPVNSTLSAPPRDVSQRAAAVSYPWVEGDVDADEAPAPAAQRAASVSSPAGHSRSRSRLPWWIIAAAWPLIVGGGVIWYVRHLRPHSLPLARPVAVVAPAPAPAARVVPTTAPLPAEAGNSVPLAVHVAATQKLESAQKTVDEDEKTIAQLRASLAEEKEELAAVKTRALSGALAQAELDKLKTDFAQAQAQLATAATRPAAPSVDRTVELFRDELELWPGDGNGPPDSLLLESYPPPDGLLVERLPTKIIFKSVAVAPPDGVKPVPVQLAVIKIDGDRVLMEWITANRGQISSAVRAWLQLSRLTVQRQGVVVQKVRFVAPRTAAINLEREMPVSVMPEMRWKDAVKNVALAAPDALPQGWSARAKDPHTMTISNLRVPDAAFDVKLLVTEPGDVQAQTTFGAAFGRLRETATEQLTTSRNKALVERSMQQIRELADVTGTRAKDPARQNELDAARHDLDAATASQRDSQVVHRAAAEALAELANVPPLSVQVVNRDNGLVLCTLHIKRGL